MRARRPLCVCQWCGTAYWPKATGRVTYCSRACAYAKRRYDGLDAVQQAIEQVIAKRTCERCGQPFHPKTKRARWCSTRCHDAYRWVIEYRRNHPWHNAAERPCHRCGTLTKASRRGRTACARCKAIVDRINHKTAKWRRKARMKGADVQPFRPHDVHMRDGYRCQICGTKTNPKASPCSDRYPTLDHIIPLSRGGAHSRENTQTACRRCNMAKAADLVPTQTRWLA
jgi:5-methylcytosine-specific restriction endonuclease McrA